MSEYTFQDSAGRQWDLEISLAAAKRIDSCDFSELIEEEISFLEPPPKFFELVLQKTSLQFAIIWCIIQPQAMKLGLDQDAFCEGIKPAVLTPAKQALWRAIADFFPHLRTSLVRLAEIHSKHLLKADQKLAELGDKVEKLSDQELDRALEQLEQDILAAVVKRGTTSTVLPPMPA